MSKIENWQNLMSLLVYFFDASIIVYFFEYQTNFWGKLIYKINNICSQKTNQAYLAARGRQDLEALTLHQRQQLLGDCVSLLKV